MEERCQPDAPRGGGIMIKREVVEPLGGWADQPRADASSGHVTDGDLNRVPGRARHRWNDAEECERYARLSGIAISARHGERLLSVHPLQGIGGDRRSCPAWLNNDNCRFRSQKPR